MKVTPDDFIKMNEEFESEGTPMVLIVPTQEQIDNPTGHKIPPGPYPPQKPMNFDDPWPHTNSSMSAKLNTPDKVSS